MIIKKVTKEKLNKWRKLFDANKALIVPNRKSGDVINDYFVEKFTPKAYESVRFVKVVERNIMSNKVYHEKFRVGSVPKIKTYQVNDSVLVGIDLETGFFHVESEDFDSMEEIYNDLFVFRGLDEIDVNNFVLVGQYLELIEK